MGPMADEERHSAGGAGPSEEVPENPLHRKLGLRPGVTGAVIASTEDTVGLLAPLPEQYLVLKSVEELAALEGPFDYLHLFALSRADLVRDFHRLRDKLAPGG